ncbi:uncharacterized protein LOC106666529 isoform X2 [Cimex lectularius]|uniref:Uncharacterized protein n=1 Tax=Cimex lectularius TaxID=79782 RepID=A0A8I6RQG5_CIMLE|nr:uncharacterized protein LOC106666529 isoform X2 [Cimex lectularius]
MIHHFGNLEAHQKWLEMNKKLTNKVAQQELALSRAQKKNFNMTKEMIDLMFTLIFIISLYNELKQIFQNLLTDLNKTLTSDGDISVNLQQSYQYFAEHFKKFDISSIGNLRSQLNMVTKPESQMPFNPSATGKPFKSNPQELYARKKNSQVVKLHSRQQATLSPIAEIKSPKIMQYFAIEHKQIRIKLGDLTTIFHNLLICMLIIQSRRTQGGKFFDKGYFLRSSNQFQSTIRQYSTSDNNNCENSGKRTDFSQNLKSSKKKSITFEPSPEQNIATVNSLKLIKEEASSIFEEATETKNKRTKKKKSQVYSPKKCQSSKRNSNYTAVEESLENNCCSSDKEKGIGPRRSLRIKERSLLQKINR